MRAALLLALALAGPAQATVFYCSNHKGTLASAQVATGRSANMVCCTATQEARTLVLEYATSAGTATVAAEMTCDGGATWMPVATSSQAIGTTTPNGVGIVFPQCCYATNATACAGCSVTTTFYAGPEIH